MPGKRPVAISPILLLVAKTKRGHPVQPSARVETESVSCQLPVSTFWPELFQPEIPADKCFTFLYPSFLAAFAAA